MAIITKKQGTLEYLTAEGIATPHCFTTRLGGVSKEHLASLNIGMHRGDTAEAVAENYRILGKAVGFEPSTLVLTGRFIPILSVGWVRQTAMVWITGIIRSVTV